MNKLEFCELPESVQIIAAEVLKQQMNCCGQSEWAGEAKRIAKAFLAMYECADADIKLEVTPLFTQEQLDGLREYCNRHPATGINGEVPWQN